MAFAEPKEDLVQDVQSESNTLDEIAVDPVSETDAFPAAKNRGSLIYDKKLNRAPKNFC